MYPYVRALLSVDGKALMDTLDLVFHAEDVRFVKSVDLQMTMEEWHGRLDVVQGVDGNRDGDGGFDGGAANNNGDDDNSNGSDRDDDVDNRRTICPDRMHLVCIISYVLSSLSPTSPTEPKPKTDDHQVAREAFYDFLSRLLLSGHVRT